jgi:serine/threonine-protein kinase
MILDLKEGAIIRDYKVISLLGEGGMGKVWLVEDTMLGRKLALKVLSPQMAMDNSLVERFTQEARIQQKLKHDNIVSLIAFFQEAGTYYIAMEYAPGISLKQLIGRTGPITSERAVPMMLQILSALAYTHSLGIIHRDIKPSNIMIDPDNQDHVMIMDFGIAKAVQDYGKTHTGSQIGTVYYMSPEQVKDSKRVDHRTDIFSAGITFYEILTGRVPYDTGTDSSFAIQTAIVNEPLPDPRQIYKFIPDYLVQMLQKMCAKDVGERFTDCNEILDYLDEDDEEEFIPQDYGLQVEREDAEPQEVKMERAKIVSQIWVYIGYFFIAFCAILILRNCAGLLSS